MSVESMEKSHGLGWPWLAGRDPLYFGAVGVAPVGGGAPIRIESDGAKPAKVGEPVGISTVLALQPARRIATNINRKPHRMIKPSN
jgi:hypothetical protein